MSNHILSIWSRHFRLIIVINEYFVGLRYTICEQIMGRMYCYTGVYCILSAAVTAVTSRNVNRCSCQVGDMAHLAA